MEKKKLENVKNKKEINPLLLMVIVVCLCAVATYIIPAGQYDIAYNEAVGKDTINPESFMYIERSPATLFTLLQSLTLGLQNGSYVVFFLLIIGGMFGILNGTGALNIGIANLLKNISGHEYYIIPILMIFFGCGSAFCGNFEEFLVFVPLILACCITVGFDSLTAVGIIFMSAAAGYGGGITNTFTVGTAQEIAGLPRFSGMNLRIALFVVLELASIIYVLSYARLVRKNQQLSICYAFDMEHNQDKRINLDNIPEFTKRQLLVVIIFLLGIIYAVYGIIKKGYYVDELSGIFLAIGIIGGIAGGLKPNEICNKFIKGCGDMLLPGIMIGLANASVLLLQNAKVMDTILHALAGLITNLPHTLMACGMFLFHLVFNVVVPSGSAQATITMPLMTTLADNTEITRQTAVLAYQLGDSFTNVLSPTGGEILAALAICKVPFSKWIKFLLPLFVIWCVIALVFLVYATKLQYGPL